MNNLQNMQSALNQGNNNQSNFFQNNYNNQNMNYQFNDYQNYQNNNNYNQNNINNQNMPMYSNNQMNYQNNKQMNQNQIAYNNISLNNQNENYKNKIYPSKIQNYTCEIEKESELIDRNEVNAIKNIIQLNLCNYKYLVDKNITLSDSIADNIKKKLGGEWFVFVLNKNKNISLNLSSITEKDFLIFNVGNDNIKIARIK